MDKLKGCWKSVTIWFNSLALACLPLFDLAHEYLPEIGQYLTPNMMKVVGVVIIVGNIVLRFKTNKSLADK